MDLACRSDRTRSGVCRRAQRQNKKTRIGGWIVVAPPLAYVLNKNQKHLTGHRESAGARWNGFERPHLDDVITRLENIHVFALVLFVVAVLPSRYDAFRELKAHQCQPAGDIYSILQPSCISEFGG
jgi:hypothetical protein